MGKVITIRGRSSAGLSDEATRLWNEVQADFEISDAAGLAVLRQLVEVLDHIRACQAQVAADGLMVKGSRGQKRPHPLLREISESRRTFLGCCRALNLDLTPP